MAFPGSELIRRERARIRHFLGSDLPPRLLELRFGLLPPRRCASKPPRSEKQLYAKLQANRATPSEYMEALLSLTRSMNRCPMPAARRFARVDALARWLYIEVAPKLKEMADATTGIPEHAGRAAQLDQIEETVQALLYGYQLVFAADYERSRFWYARVRDRVHQCAARILELIKLKHRITGLRYAPLPPETWRLANTVFAVMRACESTNVPLPTLGANEMAIAGPRQASLDQLYAWIQTYHILDYSAWPEQGQFFIDEYCSAVDGGIRIHDHDGSSLVAAKDTMLAACYQETPPARTLTAGNLGPVVIIDYRILADSIRLDYVELSRARADRNRFAMPRRLARVEPVHQTAIGYLLYRNLRLPDQWGDLGGARQRHRDLRIYVGYDEVRAHLLSIFASEGRATQSRELSNLFARRSAMIGEDDSATKESLWYVLYEGAERMRIKTQETRFTTRMFIGNLLAYGFGRRQVFQPRIGKVNRIYRPEPGTVVIDIEYLASYGTPVTLHRRDVSAPAEAGKLRVIGHPLRALLIHHPKRGWGIITPPQEGFWEQTAVGIQNGRRVTLATLGEARDVTDEFCWFSMDSKSFPQQSPGYPEHAAANAAEIDDIDDIA
jgi:hypothetical protein